MRTPDEPLRNARNDALVSRSIKEYFRKFPESAPLECCRVLGLEYSKYGGRARKIKYDITHWMQSTVAVTDSYGRLLKPLVSVHRQEFGFKEPVPASYVLVLEEKALAGRVQGGWYRSSNRNRQLEYFDDHVSVRVYPKSGTCRIHPCRDMTFEDVRVHVSDAFAKFLPASALRSDSFQEMINGLQVARKHRTFYIGPVTRFKVDFYLKSLGLSILSDGSHPEHLEVRENWPAWIPALMELQRKNTIVLSEFAAQISSHLHVMLGIGLAVDRLNQTLVLYSNSPEEQARQRENRKPDVGDHRNQDNGRRVKEVK